MGPTRVHFVDDPRILRCKVCRKTGNLQVKLGVWMEVVLVHTEVVFGKLQDRKVPHPAFKKLQRRLTIQRSRIPSPFRNQKPASHKGLVSPSLSLAQQLGSAHHRDHSDDIGLAQNETTSRPQVLVCFSLYQ